MSTNFNIDAIKPNTRFSELPTQAQRELEELYNFICAEKQRCEYIKNHLGVEHGKTMERIQTQTDKLTQVIYNKDNFYYRLWINSLLGI